MATKKQEKPLPTTANIQKPVANKKKPTVNKTKTLPTDANTTEILPTNTDLLPTTANSTEESVNTADILRTDTDLLPTDANSTETTVNTTDVEDLLKGFTPIEDVENDPIELQNHEQPLVNKRFQITISFNDKEAEHIKALLEQYIEFGVVKDNSEFGKICIDYCINHNAMCAIVGKELSEKMGADFLQKLNLNSVLQFPYPDGQDGSTYVEPKILSKSLFNGVKQLPTLN